MRHAEEVTEKTRVAPARRLPIGFIRFPLSAFVTLSLTIGTAGVPALAGSGVAEFHGPGLQVAGDPPVLLAERTGVYWVGGRVVLANLFDDRESDIGRDGDRVWSATVRPPAPLPTSGRHEVDWWLYLAAATLLGLEWIVWLRKEPA